MPEADAPEAPRKGGMPKALTQRVGPLPLWGWGIAALGILAGVLYLKHRGSLGASGTSAGLLSGGTPPAQPVGSGSAGGDTGGGTVIPPVQAPPGTGADPLAGLIHIDPTNPTYYIDAQGQRQYGGSATPTQYGYWDSRGVWMPTPAPVTGFGPGGNPTSYGYPPAAGAEPPPAQTPFPIPGQSQNPICPPGVAHVWHPELQHYVCAS